MITKAENVHGRGRVRAFTLIELLATLFAICLLSLLMVRGMAGARDGSQTAQCLSNHRRLITAWQMYAADNRGYLVGNPFGNTPAAGYSRWAQGWLDSTTSADNTNTVMLTDDRYAYLAKYLNRDALVYQCPADTYISRAQADRGGWTRRSRSYSMNQALGETASPPSLPSPYKRAIKLQDLSNPGPGNTFVFIEEHPDSINDPTFMLPTDTTLMDWPSVLHNGGAVVSFADGHVDTHDWEGMAIRPPIGPVKLDFQVSPKAPPGDPDIHWVSWHSPRVSSASN